MPGTDGRVESGHGSRDSPGRPASSRSAATRVGRSIGPESVSDKVSESLSGTRLTRCCLVDAPGAFDAADVRFVPREFVDCKAAILQCQPPPTWRGTAGSGSIYSDLY